LGAAANVGRRLPSSIPIIKLLGGAGPTQGPNAQ